MKKFVLAALAAAILVGGATPATADCKGDLAALKATLAREKDRDVIIATSKHVKRAEIETRGSESECRNAVTRGWRTLSATKAAIAQAEAKQAAEKRAR